MQNRKFGALSSSINPEQLSARVSGAILMFSSLVILVANWIGFPLAESQVAELAQQAGMAVGGMWFLFGFFRKLVISLQKKWSEYQNK